MKEVNQTTVTSNKMARKIISELYKEAKRRGIKVTEQRFSEILKENQAVYEDMFSYASDNGIILGEQELLDAMDEYSAQPVVAQEPLKKKEPAAMQDLESYLADGSSESQENQFAKNVAKAKGLRTASRRNPDGTSSTVKFTSFEEDGLFKVVPTLFPKDPNNQTEKPEDWIELPFKDALKVAKARGEVFEFKTEQEAVNFAEGGWKNYESPIKPKKPWEFADEESVAAWMKDADKRARQREKDAEDYLKQLEESKKPFLEGDAALFVKAMGPLGGLVDDLAKEAYRGFMNGQSTDEAMSVLLGGKISNKDLEKYIEAVKIAEDLPPSESMLKFNKKYKEEGGGFWGFLSAIWENPKVAPEVTLSSLIAMLNPASLTAAGSVVGVSAGTGAALGSILGPGGTVIGATEGALSSVPWAMAAAGATLETASSFTEFLREELNKKGLEFSVEGVKEVLNDSKAYNTIRAKAAARGISIGLIDAFTGKIAGKVGAKGFSATEKLPIGTRAFYGTSGTAIEMTGGAAGEATARGIVGQDMDAAEIGLEAIGEVSGAPINIAAEVMKNGKSGYGAMMRKAEEATIAKGGQIYRINGETISKKKFDKILEASTVETMTSTAFEIHNDPETQSQLEAKFKDLSTKDKIKKANPKISDEKLSKMAKLEIELESLKGNDTEVATQRRSAIKEQIKTITAEPDAKPKMEGKPIEKVKSDTRKKLEEIWSKIYSENRNREILDDGFINNRAFNDAVQYGSDNYASHGLAKSGLGNALNDLFLLFENGIDTNRRGGLDVAPITNSSRAQYGTTGGGTSYRDGAFILVGRNGHSGQFTDISQIGGILVNDGVVNADPNIIEMLRQHFPNLVIDSYNNTSSVIQELNNRKTETSNTNYTNASLDVVPENINEEDAKAWELAKTYKDRLTKLKAEQPETYWSVDLPEDEVLLQAAKENRISDVNGGMGLVMDDKELAGLFKYDETKKGVAKAVQEDRIAKGGNHLNAYDTGGLVENYKKQGFKEIARIPFNEELAPKDMPAAERAKKPDVVFMVHDPNDVIDAEDVREFDTYEEANQYTKLMSSPQQVENRSAATQKFFSDVVTGREAKYKPKRPWKPLMAFSKAEEKFKKIYDKFVGNFDEHISTSIPGFRDIQIKVGNAITRMLEKTGGVVYDIGGSEGGFVKAITQSSGGKIRSYNLDPNEDMRKSHESNPVEGSEFIREAFEEGFTDNGIEYQPHEPKEKADVVHESMTFQFIKHKRDQFIKAVVGKYLKEDGVFITEEKLIPPSNAQFAANEAKKDKDFKLKYYDESQLDAKREEVLTGMVKNQTARDTYVKLLKENFKYVSEYWDSGNFKGYIATNSKEKMDAFLKEVGDTDTEFSEKSIAAGGMVDKQELADLRELVGPSSNVGAQQQRATGPRQRTRLKAEPGNKVKGTAAYARLTEDGEGNYVFYHVGQEKYDEIRPSTGATSATSREERQALSRSSALAMYYTAENERESMVNGPVTYMVKVPKDKVYDANSDVDGLIVEARERFEAKNPGMAFTPNDQIAMITKIANEKGYEMVVAEWSNDGRLRAQSTIPLKPSDVQVVRANTLVKQFDKSYPSNMSKGYIAVRTNDGDSYTEIADPADMETLEGINRVIESMKLAFPNVSVIIGDSVADARTKLFDTLVGLGYPRMLAYRVVDQFTDMENGQSIFIGGKPVAVVMNSTVANSGTAGHEMWEMILNQAFKNDTAKLKKFKEAIYRRLTEMGHKKMADELQAFASQYEGDLQFSEFLAEFGGRLVQGGIDVANLSSDQKSLMTMIKEVINKFSMALIGKEVFLSDATPENIFEFMTAISDKVARGESIADVIGNKPESWLDMRGPADVRSQVVERSDTFYSTVESALEAIKQSKGTPQQFKAELIKNGAKQAELEWMGFDDTFTGNSVTKSDIQKWIAENRIDIKEIELSDDDATYSGWVIPGGYDYKELLLTMPAANRFVIKKDGSGYSIWDNKSQDWFSKGYGKMWFENETLAQYSLKTFNKEFSVPVFNSSHFSQPNILAHVRFNSRYVRVKNPEYIEDFIPDFDKEYTLIDNGNSYSVKSKRSEVPYVNTYKKSAMEKMNMDIDGLKKYLMGTELKYTHPDYIKNSRYKTENVLFLEEIQSDWAQEGKRSGFSGEDTSEAKRLKEERAAVSDKLKKIEDELNSVIKEAQDMGLPSGASSSQWNQFRSGKFKSVEVYRIEDKQDKVRNNRDYNEFQSMLDEISDNQKRIGKRWIELIVDRDATETKITELDMEIRIASDTANKTPDMPVKKTDQWVNLAFRRMMKYAAENGFDRIAWTNGDQQFVRYTDPDNESQQAKVRKEGMKVFYDSIIPAQANKLGKPFGVKVEEIKMKNIDINTFQESPNLTQQSIPINDAIKAMAGKPSPVFPSFSVRSQKTSTETVSEMDSIKKEAIKSNMFMKAPNGNPTNLNEKQWLQVRTSNFKNWFGDWERNPAGASKVVDANGEPMVVYHGSVSKDITEFSLSESKNFNTKGDLNGVYFTDNIGVASNYAKENPFPNGEYNRNASRERGKIYPSFLNLRNPINTTKDIEIGRENGMTFGNAKRSALSKIDLQSNDGVMFDGNEYNPAEFVVLNPKQIKSAIANDGKFNPNDVDIRSQVINAEHTPEFTADKFLSPEFEMPRIIDLGRNNGFSDESIKAILMERGFKAADIAKAMEVKLSVVSSVPKEFGNVEGGIKEGTELFKDVRNRLIDFMYANPEKPRTISEVREKAMEFMKEHPIYKQQSERIQKELMISFDKTLKTSANKNIQEQISILKTAINERRKEGADIKRTQMDLRIFIRKMLPKSTYSRETINKFIKQVSDATPKTIDKAIVDIIAAVTKQRVKDAKARIERLLSTKTTVVENALLKGRLMPDAQERLAKLNDDILLDTTDPVAISEKIAKLEAEYNDLDNKQDATDADIDRMLDLEFLISYNSALLLDDTEGAKLNALEETIDRLTEFLTEARQEYKATVKAKKDYYNKLKSDFFFDVTGIRIDFSSKESIAEARAELTKRNNLKNNRPRFIQFLSNLTTKTGKVFTDMEALEGVLDRVSRMPGEMFEGKSAELILNRVDESTDTYKAGVAGMNDFMAENAERIFGKDWRKAFKKNSQPTSKLYHNPARAYEIIELLKNESLSKEDVKKLNNELSGITEMVSQSQMYYIYNMAKDPANHPGLQTTFGPMFMEIIEDMTTRIDPKVKEWADWQVNVFFPSVYPRYNSVYKELYRTNMPWNENYAGRLYREGEPDNVDVLSTSQQYRTSIASTSTKLRQKNNNKIRMMNGDKVLATYVREMEYFRAYAENMRDIENMVKNPDVKNGISVTTGQDAYQILTKLLDKFTSRSLALDAEFDVLDFFSRTFIVSKLGINPTIFLKQATAFVTFADFIGYRNFTKYGALAIADNAKGFNRQWKEIYDNSIYVKDRFEWAHIDRVIGSYTAEKGATFLDNKTMDKMSDFMMWMVKKGDMGGVMGSIPNYMFYKDQYRAAHPKADEQDVIDYAIKKIERQIKTTQQSNDIQDKDIYQMGHQLVRYFSIFLSQPKAYLRKEIIAVRNLYRKMTGKESKGTIKENVRTIFTYHVVAPMFFQWISIGLPGLLSGWDDEDKEDMIRSGILGNLNAIFALGDIINSIADLIQDKPWATNIRNLPLFESYQDIALSYKKFRDSKSEEVKTKNLVKVITKAAEPATGIPFGNIQKIGSNYKKVLTGETEDFGEAVLRLFNYNEYAIKGNPVKKEKKEKGSGINKENLRKIDPELYNQLYGPGSPTYEIQQAKRELRSQIDLED